MRARRTRTAADRSGVQRLGADSDARKGRSRHALAELGLKEGGLKRADKSEGERSPRVV